MHNTVLTVDDSVLSSESPFCNTAVCRELNGQCVSHCSYVLGDGVPTCSVEKKQKEHFNYNGYSGTSLALTPMESGFIKPEVEVKDKIS